MGVAKADDAVTRIEIATRQERRRTDMGTLRGLELQCACLTTITEPIVEVERSMSLPCCALWNKQTTQNDEGEQRARRRKATDRQPALLHRLIEEVSHHGT